MQIFLGGQKLKIFISSISTQKENLKGVSKTEKSNPRGNTVVQEVMTCARSQYRKNKRKAECKNEHLFDLNYGRIKISDSGIKNLAKVNGVYNHNFRQTLALL